MGGRGEMITILYMYKEVQLQGKRERRKELENVMQSGRKDSASL